MKLARDNPIPGSFDNPTMKYGLLCPRPTTQLGPLPLARFLLLFGFLSVLTTVARASLSVTWKTVSQKIMTGATPQSIAVGDFNGDGNADFAVGQTGSIGIFLGYPRLCRPSTSRVGTV
jgi:hypothetical protein